ncbi:hypothetical protein SAMN05216337_107517 [Bradyrhizobium brasilense]|uniref:Uncharacterized protein n=1 Tax=Bradyrhizobium brasilense TaxID=1419277 RepID=A0A1G7P460_9BRAD|nr:hypothetical protein SAMN05216337_107517 [Bradyrhizobium brasilense]
MAYNVNDRETDRIIRELAALKGKPILDCIRDAREHEIQRERLKTPHWDRLQPLLDRIASAHRRYGVRSVRKGATSWRLFRLCLRQDLSRATAAQG